MEPSPSIHGKTRGRPAAGSSPRRPSLRLARRRERRGRAGSSHVRSSINIHCPERAESRPRQAAPAPRPLAEGTPGPARPPPRGKGEAAANRGPNALRGASPVSNCSFTRPLELKQGPPGPIRRAPSRRGSSLPRGAAPPQTEGGRRAGAAQRGGGDPGEGREEAQERRGEAGGEGHPPAGEEAGGTRAPSPGSPSCGGSPPPRCAAPGPAGGRPAARLASPWSPGDGRSGGCRRARALAPPPAAEESDRDTAPAACASAAPGRGRAGHHRQHLLLPAPPSLPTAAGAGFRFGPSRQEVPSTAGSGVRPAAGATPFLLCGELTGEARFIEEGPRESGFVLSRGQENTSRPGSGVARAGAALRASAGAFPPVLVPRSRRCPRGAPSAPAD